MKPVKPICFIAILLSFVTLLLFSCGSSYAGQYPEVEGTIKWELVPGSMGKSGVWSIDGQPNLRVTCYATDVPDKNNIIDLNCITYPVVLEKRCVAPLEEAVLYCAE